MYILYQGRVILLLPGFYLNSLLCVTMGDAADVRGELYHAQDAHHTGVELCLH